MISFAHHCLGYFDICAFNFNTLFCCNYIRWKPHWPRKRSLHFFDVQFCLSFFFYQLFGLLADVKLGRYKAIITGVHFSFMSWIFGALSANFKSYSDLAVLFLILFTISNILQGIEYSCFRSSIVQYNVDQLVGASADELSVMIYWESINIPLINLVIEIAQCLIKQVINYARKKFPRIIVPWPTGKITTWHKLT